MQFQEIGERVDELIGKYRRLTENKKAAIGATTTVGALIVPLPGPNLVYAITAGIYTYKKVQSIREGKK